MEYQGTNFRVVSMHLLECIWSCNHIRRGAIFGKKNKRCRSFRWLSLPKPGNGLNRGLRGLKDYTERYAARNSPRRRKAAEVRKEQLDPPQFENTALTFQTFPTMPPRPSRLSVFAVKDLLASPTMATPALSCP